MRLGQWVGLIALVISLYILWQLRQILLLIFAAVVFATGLNRIVRSFQQYGIRRSGAVTFTALSLLLLLVGLLAIVVPRFVNQFQQLFTLTPQVLNQLRNWLNWLENSVPGQIFDTDNLIETIPGIQNFINQIFGNMYYFFSNVSSTLLSILFCLVLMIMLLTNPNAYRQGFVALFPSFYRQRVNQILSECETKLVGWMMGTLINMVTIAIVSFIGLLLLGVPLPLINALLAGLLEFIPNIGPTLSVIPPAALALLSAPWKSIAVIILYILIQQFEAYLLVPYVMKNQASLLPAVTFCAVVIFGALFGFLGVFLAVPLVIVVKIWLKEILVSDIMSDWHLPRNQQAHNFAAVRTEIPGDSSQAGKE